MCPALGGDSGASVAATVEVDKVLGAEQSEGGVLPLEHERHLCREVSQIPLTCAVESSYVSNN